MTRRHATVLFVSVCCLMIAGCSTSGSFLLNSVLPSDGNGNQSSEPVGACCLPSGACLTVTASDCNAFFGIFFGEGLICGIAPCENLFAP